MKTVLLTGANGYIGRHVVDALTNLGAEVIAIDRRVDESVPATVHFSFDIFEDSEKIQRQLPSAPDACLHLAWRDGFNHSAISHMEDLPRHFEFLTMLADLGVKQIAVMGSMHEVGYWEGAITEDTPCNPQSLYGVAKNALREALAIELPKMGSMLQWIRGYYLFGDDENAQSIFGKLLRAAKNGDRFFPFTTGRNKYDFLHVSDLANQIAAVVMQDRIAGIINCCSGCPISLADQVEHFIADNGLDIELEYGAFPDRPYDSPGVWGDNTKIREIMSMTSD